MHSHPILDISVKYLDVFHLKNMYRMMQEWLRENGYTDSERGGLEWTDGELQESLPEVKIPENYMEVSYLEKISQKLGRQVVFLWRVQRAMSSYVHRKLSITVIVVGLKDVEVMAKGHKFKSQKGEVEVKIKAELVTDPNDKWKNNPVMGRFVDWFRKRVFYPEWLKAVEDFARDVYKFQEDVKKYLEIRATTPQEIFRPKKGI